MNSKSVKGRGKRFLAGFLALLMAVTLLPANVAGVAYAEELDGIETEAPDGVVAADDETEAAGNVVEADEETDEPQVNEGESSEVVEPEDGLNADEEDLALEEAVPELETAVAVASEEGLEPAEVSAAVAANTTGYEEKVNDDDDTKIRSWTFSSDYWTEKKLANTIPVNTNIDGIIVKDGTVAAKSTEGISLYKGAKIDIPVDDDTDAIAIEITLSNSNSSRNIKIGAGSNQETVYHTSGQGSPSFSGKNDDPAYYYTNATLYKNEDDNDKMFSSVLSIEADSSKDGNEETKIMSIVLHEYKEVVEPVALNDATVDLSVGTDKAKTAVYTGEPVALNVVVTKPGEDGATDTVNPKAYSKSFLRETDGAYEATEDLTTVGKIKVKVTSIETTPTDAESNEFTITPATLTLATNDDDGNEVISIAAEQKADYASAELDLTTLIEPLSEKDTFTYTLVTDNGYVAGDVVSGTPEIDAGKLKYAVDQTADSNSTATVLVVKVESKNYDDAYIKVTVSIADKPSVTVSGNSVTHTYDGAAYGFKAKATIAVTGLELTGDALNDAIEDIKENLTYKFTKVVNGTPDETTKTSTEPTDAGVYKVTAELSTASDYAMTQYTDGVTLTIEPKTVTIKPNDITWDKILKDHPVAPETVKATDYTCDGLLGNDELNITNMTIKYCKHGTKTEMSESEWAALGEDDVVDIVADGATASDNYKIEYEVGTINVLIRTITSITALTDKKSSFVATDVPTSQINADSTVKKDTLVNGFLLTGESSKVDTPKNAVDAGYPSVSYTKRLKSGPSGNQYLNSVGFKIEKAANLYIVAAADSSSDKRPMALYKLNEDTNEIEECVNTKYSINVQTVTPYDKTYVAYDSTAKTGGIELTDSTTRKADYLNIELTAAGTYYLAAAASGIVFYEVTVTYKDNEEEDTVEFTTDPTLSTSQDATLTTPHPGDVLTVSYALNLATGKTDASTIAWYRVKDGQADTLLTADATDTTGKTYTVTADDVGSKIKVVVTPKDSDGTTGTAKNAETGTVRVAGEENIGFATAPTLSISAGGSLTAPKPDDVLTVSYVLNAEGTDASVVEWYRGETKIATATGKTYTVTAEDVGSVITVKVTPQIADGTPGDAVTVSTGTVISGQQGETIILTSVTLGGEAKVGKTLTANLTFDPAQTSVPTGVTYKWYRISGGTETEISGETGSSYKLTDADEGKSVKVVVTFGETSKDFTSDTVAANTSATTGEGLEIEFDDGTTYTYTGAKITPSITVTNNGVELVEGTDYTVKYTNNIKVGKASGDAYDKKAPSVTVTGKGNLSGKISANFTINARSLKDADAGDVVVVDGSKATLVLLYNGVKLTAKDYEVTEPSDFKTKKWAATDAGADKITVKGKGNFSDAAEDAISLDVKVITKEESKNAKITADFADKAAVKALTYTGESQKPAMTVSNKGKAADLVADTDYIISYPADTTSAGAKKITILGISEKCTGSVTKSYTIKPAKGGALTVTGVKDSYEFVSTGVTFGDEVTVSYVDTDKEINSELTEGVDYKITYTNNKKAGTAKYAVTGLGNYKGLKTAKTDFTITGLALSGTDSNIKVIVGDKLFTKPGVYKSVPSVIVNGELVKASEYTVSYKVGDETDWSAKPSKITSVDDTVGYVTVKVQIKAKKATGNYGGTVTAGEELEGEYKVVSSDSKKDLAKAKVVFYTKDGAKAAKVGYTGNEVTPYKAVISCKGAEDVTIILDEEDADYATKGFEVTYANNVLKGKATVVIEAKDDNATYAGSKTATFSIVQKNLQKDLGENEGFIKAMSGFFKPFFN